MITIFGSHVTWTRHDLGAPIASVVALPVALGALYLLNWLRAHATDEPRPPRPSPVVRAVIAVISVATIVAAICVIGRYWTGSNLAHWAWTWGVRWGLLVLIVVITLILDIRWETKRQINLDLRPKRQRRRGFWRRRPDVQATP